MWAHAVRRIHLPSPLPTAPLRVPLAGLAVVLSPPAHYVVDGPRPSMRANAVEWALAPAPAAAATAVAHVTAAAPFQWASPHFADAVEEQLAQLRHHLTMWPHRGRILRSWQRASLAAFVASGEGAAAAPPAPAAPAAIADVATVAWPLPPVYVDAIATSGPASPLASGGEPSAELWTTFAVLFHCRGRGDDVPAWLLEVAFAAPATCFRSCWHAVGARLCLRPTIDAGGWRRRLALPWEAEVAAAAAAAAGGAVS